MKRVESIQAQLAPHVEPAWANQLLIELRLRGVAGEQIGAALAEVESHCAESGESAGGAFGDPAAYAASLDLPVDPRQHPAAIGRTVVPIIAQVIGLLLLLDGLPALRHGTPVGLRLGEVIWLALFAALTMALVIAAGPILRFLVSRPVLGVLAALALIVLLVTPTVLAPAVIAQLPAWLVVLAAVLLIAGGAAVVRLRARHEPTDLISSPIPGQATAQPGAVAWLSGLVVPAIALVFGLVLWLLS